MKKTIAIAGTFDSKAEEFLYLKESIEKQGVATLMIHTGVFEPKFTPDISNHEVASAVGGDIDAIAEERNRGEGTKLMAQGLEKLLPRLYEAGRFDGVISAGGSGGTSIVTPAMRALPIGVPKIMISTVAGGDVSVYVGASDILMMPSIVDVAGLNAISRKIFTNACLAITGMVTGEAERAAEHKSTIATSMFGVTTPCVEHARKVLEEKGYEVLVFHATGTGGKTMEKLVEDGLIDGVLDLTTTEWCDQLFGGNMAGGDHRLEAAVKQGVPQVVSVGALDMINFGPPETVPEKYADRKFYYHNPTVTLMRTTKENNETIGKVIAEKLNNATSEMVLLLPERGVSALDAEGQDFHDPEADTALFKALKAGLNNPLVRIEDLDLHLNDEAFAEEAVRQLLKLMDEKQGGQA